MAAMHAALPCTAVAAVTIDRSRDVARFEYMALRKKCHKEQVLICRLGPQATGRGITLL